MHDPLFMREVHDFRNLTQQIQALIDGQLLVGLSQEVIKPKELGVVFKDQCGTKFMLREAFAAQDAGMLECLQQLGFTASGSFDGLAFVERSPGSDVVDTNATTNVFKRRMGRLPVLIPRPFVDQFVKFVVANLTTSLRWSNARLLYRLGNHLSRGAVMSSLRIGVEPIALAAFDGCQNARAGRLVSFGCTIAKTNVVASGALQFTSQVRSRAEHNRFDERNLPLALARFLPLQKKSKLLGLGIGELVRVIDRRQLAVGFPSPSSGITAKSPRSALDLDEKEALRREDEQIDFVDAAVVGNELKVAPCSIRLVRRELHAHEVQSVPFPRKARLGDRRPVLRYCHCWEVVSVLREPCERDLSERAACGRDPWLTRQP